MAYTSPALKPRLLNNVSSIAGNESARRHLSNGCGKSCDYFRFAVAGLYSRRPFAAATFSYPHTFLLAVLEDNSYTYNTFF